MYVRDPLLTCGWDRGVQNLSLLDIHSWKNVRRMYHWSVCCLLLLLNVCHLILRLELSKEAVLLMGTQKIPSSLFHHLNWFPTVAFLFQPLPYLTFAMAKSYCRLDFSHYEINLKYLKGRNFTGENFANFANFGQIRGNRFLFWPPKMSIRED